MTDPISSALFMCRLTIASCTQHYLSARQINLDYLFTTKTQILYILTDSVLGDHISELFCEISLQFKKALFKLGRWKNKVATYSLLKCYVKLQTKNELTMKPYMRI